MEATPIVLNFALVDVKYALMSVISLGATPSTVMISYSNSLPAKVKVATNSTKHIKVSYRVAPTLLQCVT